MRKRHEVLAIATIETAQQLHDKGVCITCYDGKYCTIEWDKSYKEILNSKYGKGVQA